MSNRNDLRGISGTPWHIGYVTKDEDDPRRDKRVCMHYYRKGRCNLGGACIGSSHCRDYKRGGEDHAKDIKRAKSAGWQAEARMLRVETIIQRNDAVKVFCKQTQKEYTFIIPKGDDEELAPIHRQCLGKHRNDEISVNGYVYRIVEFTKGKYSE